MDASTLAPRAVANTVPVSVASSAGTSPTSNDNLSNQVGKQLATQGGGPVAPDTNPVVLGTHILNPPDGEIKTITLADGSMLVPVARVLPNGQQAPLSAAPFATTAANAPEYSSSAAPVAQNQSYAAGTAPGFEPKGFLHNGLYFAKFHDAEKIDLNNRDTVERRMAKSTMAYLLEEEPDVDDFGIQNIKIRGVDPVVDADLLNVNPRSYWLAEVIGVDGKGAGKQLPLVMNSDGAVFVDPRVRRF